MCSVSGIPEYADIYRLFIKFHLPLLLFRASLYYGCSRRLPFVLKTSSGRLRGTYVNPRLSEASSVFALCQKTNILSAASAVVENVGLEPRPKLPKLVCYHYTTFSISRHYLLVEWRFSSLIAVFYSIF